MTFVYVDVETTGLDPAVHQVVELAYAVGDGPILSGVVDHDLANADEAALRVCRYYERDLPWTAPEPGFEYRSRLALKGATLVAANPAFDSSFLRRRWGAAPWKYRLLDVEAYAMPVLGYDEPKGLAAIATALRARGWDIPEPTHTAASDVETLRECHQVLVAIGASQRRSWGRERGQ